MSKLFVLRRLLCPLLFLLVFQANAELPLWSKTGHRVVGEVAERYLNARTRRAVASLLNGQSLAAVSNYADEIKADPKYRMFSPWHYVNIPEGKTYSDITPSPDGDLVSGIRYCVSVLKDEGSKREDRVFYLKMLIHLIADLHQPMHVGKLEDRGGNDIQLLWFGRGSNLHKLWDAEMINDYGMSYTELARSLPQLSRSERQAMQQGELLDWVEETRAVAARVYESAKVGDKLGYSYNYKNWHTVEVQLLKGGLRLAKVLNEIFS